MTTERVEIRVRLADDSRTATIEMLVGDHVVGSMELKPHDVDYYISAMSNIRQGMIEEPTTNEALPERR
jgi:hypothetical protein